MKGQARGEDKSTTKNNHPLDALAITPVPVNYHSLWLTELWALRAGFPPADVIAITALFLAPLLLNAWLKAFPEWFPVYALAAHAQICNCFLPLPQHFHKKLFSFSVLISPSMKWGYHLFSVRGVTMRLKSPVHTTQSDILREGKQEGLIAASTIYLPSLK